MSSQPSIRQSHKAEIGNILDDLKRELHQEESFKQPLALARTDQIKLKNKFESRRSSSKKREITRIDSLEKREITRIDSVKKIANQDSFYNNSFKQPNNDTLNLELVTIKPMSKVPQNDPLKSNI